MTDIFELSLQALRCCSAVEKINKIKSLEQKLLDAQFSTESELSMEKITQPGRPALPVHVHPAEVKRRRLGSVEGRIALVHAIAHIEFNAMNLALDAVYRFRGMPHAYYRDWMRVAREESIHFQLLSTRLQELSSYYGALPAHGGMWAMAVETDYDVMVRMALVPRVLEARGLDVTPPMLDKLSAVNDAATVAIFERILTDEVEHVKIGNRWFGALCEQRGLCGEETFKVLLHKHGKAALRGPFNKPARRRAGFSEAELVELDKIEQLFREEAALS